jgi:hypothetical protein
MTASIPGPKPGATRDRGAILVIVAGLCALIAGLSIAFLSRMRGDAEETGEVMRETQARIMLLAGCDYILEAGRLGYDADPSAADPTPHEEGFGWVDVRDGGIGPKDQNGAALFTAGRWPAVGTTAICPMHVMERPPYAIQMTATYNPVDTDTTKPVWGMPYLRNPDPQPAISNQWPGTVTDANFAAFAQGDRRPRRQSQGLSWFRVHRERPSVFVITCGAGASLGFKHWGEVV